MERLYWNIAVVAAVLLAAIGHATYGQTPAQQQVQPTEQNSFYERLRAFSQYWQNRDSTAKGSGWKQYKCWQWFWEQRVYPAGKPVNPVLIYNAWREEQKLHTQQSIYEKKN